MTPGIVLAAAVWGACPAYMTGDPWPVPAQAGCPVPVAGLIYPFEHADDDRDAVLALRNAERELATAHALLAEVRDEWSPLVWFGIGIAAGAAVTWGVMEGGG